jgi:hypothetical protein
VGILALVGGCIEDGADAQEMGEDVEAAGSSDALTEQVCLLDCQWETAHYCDGIASEDCMTAQVECREDCGSSCAVQTLDDFYWCVWEATSRTQHATCQAQYCDRAAACPWLDQAAARYLAYYCD